MDELLAQFLVEGPELIQEGGEALLALEQHPGDAGLLDAAFRAIHTLKGSVGLFDLPAMGRALHAAEDAMSDLRAGRRPVDPNLISALLAILSQSERWIESLNRVGGLSAADDAVAIRLMSALAREAAETVEVERAAVGWAEALAAQARGVRGPLVAVRYRPDTESYFAGVDPIALAKETPGLAHLVLGLAEPVPGDPYDPFLCRLTLDLLSDAPLTAVEAVFRFVADQVEIVPVMALAVGIEPESLGPEPSGPEAAAVRTLRIDPRRIDALAATAADLVAAKTGLSALAAKASAGADPAVVSEALAARATALERLVGRLHDDVMALRMAPIAPFLRRFPRLARDLASSLGKEAELRVEDNGLEADKAIIEGLSEPLTHLVRNAIDHGVEPPSERELAGKPARAVVRLTARRDGVNLVLELRDDGRGVDPAVVRRKVSERGLMKTERVADLSDQAVLDLIFLPGFSTAETITEVSGRGVGMDAVRSAVLRLGGRVQLTSEVGAGACVTLTLPLSILLTKIMILKAGGELFGAPMDRVLETVRLPPDKVFGIRAGRAFDWRGRTAPLVSLSSLVGRVAPVACGDLRAVVVQCGPDIVGVVVDAILDRTDVVLQPMTGLLAAMPGVMGSTVLGDGQVLMILDIEALVG